MPAGLPLRPVRIRQPAVLPLPPPAPSSSRLFPTTFKVTVRPPAASVDPARTTKKDR